MCWANLMALSFPLTLFAASRTTFVADASLSRQREEDEMEYRKLAGEKQNRDVERKDLARGLCAMRAGDSGGTYIANLYRPPYRIIGSRGKCTSRPLCASLHRALPYRTPDGRDIVDDTLALLYPRRCIHLSALPLSKVLQ